MEGGRRMTKTEKPDRSVLEIDVNNLEVEWAKQPDLYFHWAEQAAMARLDVDEDKAAVDVTRAEVDTIVRAEPEKFGIEKMTEKTVEAAIMTSALYVRAVARLNKARFRYQVLSALVSALEQRKSALENEVRLRLANYYSEPRVPEGHKEEFGEMQKDRAFHPRRRKKSDE